MTSSHLSEVSTTAVERDEHLPSGTHSRLFCGTERDLEKSGFAPLELDPLCCLSLDLRVVFIADISLELNGNPWCLAVVMCDLLGSFELGKALLVFIVIPAAEFVPYMLCKCKLP